MYSHVEELQEISNIKLFDTFVLHLTFRLYGKKKKINIGCLLCRAVPWNSLVRSRSSLLLRHLLFSPLDTAGLDLSAGPYLPFACVFVVRDSYICIYYILCDGPRGQNAPDCTPRREENEVYTYTYVYVKKTRKIE